MQALMLFISTYCFQWHSWAR